MAGKKKKQDSSKKLVAENRKARHEYEIMDTVEAGLVLVGSEVKSLRTGKANIAESYASNEKGTLKLINSDIPIYPGANRFNHEPRRHRTLLLHKKQVTKLQNQISRDGMTIVPLRLYFNERGIAKLELAIARGKKLHDKRQTDKKRDWDRQKARLLREKG